MFLLFHLLCLVLSQISVLCTFYSSIYFKSAFTSYIFKTSIFTFSNRPVAFIVRERTSSKLISAYVDRATTDGKSIQWICPSVQAYDAMKMGKHKTRLLSRESKPVLTRKQQTEIHSTTHSSSLALFSRNCLKQSAPGIILLIISLTLALFFFSKRILLEVRTALVKSLNH